MIISRNCISNMVPVSKTYLQLNRCEATKNFLGTQILNDVNGLWPSDSRGHWLFDSRGLWLSDCLFEVFPNFLVYQLGSATFISPQLIESCVESTASTFDNDNNLLGWGDGIEFTRKFFTWSIWSSHETKQLNPWRLQPMQKSLELYSLSTITRIDQLRWGKKLQ